MNEVIHRVQLFSDLDVRADGRTVAGIAMPFDAPAEISDKDGRYVEVFRLGSFEKTIRERGDRVKAFAQHDYQKLPLGVATTLREDVKGLYTELRISKTNAGDEALELVKDGALDSFSVGFIPVKDRVGKGLVERLEVMLKEISLVSFPAYEGARILAVREESEAADGTSVDKPQPHLSDEQQARVDAVLVQLERLQQQYGETSTAVR